MLGDAHPKPSPTAVSARTFAEVAAHARALDAPALTSVVVVGDVDADAALAAIERGFGAWAPAGAPPLTVTQHVNLDAHPVHVVIGPPRPTNARLTLGCLVEAESSPGSRAALVSALLADRFDRVRAEQGGSYGTAEGFGRTPTARWITYGIDVHPTRVAPALRLLAAIVPELPTPVEVDRARWKIAAGRRAVMGEGNAGVASWISRAVIDGLPYEAQADANARVATVPVTDAQSGWSTCLKTQVWFLEGPPDLTRPAAIAVFGEDAVQ